MKRVLFIILAIGMCVPVSFAQNYVVTVSPQSATDQIEISGLSVVCDVPQQTYIQYYDDFGVPSQSCMVGVTPSGNNLVSMERHIGRKEQKWLPISTSAQTVTISEVQSAYSDMVPYETQTYDSPVTKNLRSTQCSGEGWQGHPATVQYGTNVANEVKYMYVTNGGSLAVSGSYSPRSLKKIIMVDEDGKQSISYYDREERLIMTKTAGSAYTCYVYDNLGRLRFVISPQAYPSMSNGTYPLTNITLQSLAYCYQYDSRGNMTYKRLPGSEPIYMVYDKANRMVMSQDGLLRSMENGSGLNWMMYTYDKYGRPAYSALAHVYISSHDYYQYYFSNRTVTDSVNIDASATLGTTGYTRSCMQSQWVLSPVHVWYYDDYAYLQSINDGEEFCFNQTSTFSQVQETSSLGRLTGERIYNLEDDEFISSAYYYDRKGRIIQSSSSNHLGGYTHVYTEYDFVGNPLVVLSTCSVGSSSAIPIEHNPMVEEYHYTYDHAGRLVNTTYQFCDEPEIELTENTYDELGRLSSQSIHNGVGMAHFLYNLHGQVTQNRQFGYKENLYFNTANDIVGGNSCYYNGNISSILWSFGTLDTDGPMVCNGYHYSYDSSNRLSYAQAIMYRTLQTGLTHYEAFEYDLNGNIRNLQRDNMDDIEIRYNGNHLFYADDYGDTRNQNGRKEFHGTMGGRPGAYAYDANGNLSKDLNRGISNIRYNILNLPAEITFENGNKIRHYYDASGARYHTATITNQATAILSASKMAADAPQVSGSAYQTHQFFIGNGVYWQTPTGQILLSRVQNPMGYIALTEDELTYNYYAKDYLGNVKEVYSVAGANATTAQCIQRMQYYPSGLPWENNFGADEQPYKYGGKEFVEMHSLDEYDSEARWYYPALMCTTTMDPMAEKYYCISPYAWCGNNPVNLVDPDGCFLEVTSNGDSTYTVCGGQVDDDLNIYVIENGKRTGEVLGQMLTAYSFFDDLNAAAVQAIIYMNDDSGQEFVDYVLDSQYDIISYAIKALPKMPNDFKRVGISNVPNELKERYTYRGLVISLDDGKTKRIASARDIGNFGAGYVAGTTGISWKSTRSMFDLVQGMFIRREPEAMVSQAAQILGYIYGYEASGKYIIDALRKQ